MTTKKSSTPVTELDFDYIKQDLINYLKGQEEFSDYNFEGAAMNILMDILAYNTHMNSFMANMMANEMFLDSASIRQSVVSKAKEIGYIPRSCRSSKAIVNISLNTNTAPQEIVMQAGISFDSKGGYTFSTMEDYILYPTPEDSTVYKVENVEIYDGNYMEYHYEVEGENTDQQFIIPAETVDISTLRVFVQPNKTSTEIEEYYPNDDLNRLDPNTAVYFVHEHPEGYYVVTFGDGIIGKKVINGNYITLSYIISVGREDANYNSVFIPIEDIDDHYNSYFIETIEPAFGGGEKETIEEIKMLAPRMYQSQRRAVTIQDYETFLLHDYPWIDTINSWGGEDNNPPIYGKVFFAIKPKHTEFISNRLKGEIVQDLIKKYNVVTIVPEIVDPDYLYIIINSVVFFAKTRTVSDENFLQQKTVNTIYDYFDRTTERFKLNFKFSPMVAAIDTTDPCFDSSLTNILIEKRIYPIISSLQTFDVKFNNPIIEGSIETTIFNTEDSNISGIIYDSLIKDDGKGKLYLYCPQEDMIIDSDVGNVNYETGDISITVFPYALPVDTMDIRIYATPKHKNIVSGYNQIIVPDESPENQSINRKQGVTVIMKAIEE
jgi:hypothetical protein